MIRRTKHGLDLDLIKCGPGYSYEWTDGHGKVWCCGWSRGTKRDAIHAAAEHIDDEDKRRTARAHRGCGQ